MSALFNRLRHFIASHHSRQFRIFVTLVIVAAIPLTVYVAQQAQEIRQRADSSLQSGVFPCSKDQADNGSLISGTCGAGDNCSGTQHVHYHHYDADADQYYCEWNNYCDNPVTCNGDFQCSKTEADTGLPAEDCDKGNGCTGKRYREYVSHDQINDRYYCRWSGCNDPVSCPRQNCTTNIQCSGNCREQTHNTCSANNGNKDGGCRYTGGSDNCIPADAPNDHNCTVDACADGNVCRNGSCVAPTSAPQPTTRPVATTAPAATTAPGGQGGQGVTCWICDCGDKRSQNRSGSCQQGELTSDPGTCPAAGPGCSNYVQPTTPPGQPTYTPVPTNSPTVDPGNAGTLAVKIPMQSIGAPTTNGPQRNANPQRNTRDVTVSFYTANNAPTALSPVNTTLSYDTTEKLLKGNINLTNIPAGTYRLKFSVKGFLARKSQAIALPSTTALTVSELFACNITDGDTIDIMDYSIFTTCFEGKASSQACGSFKQTADCNDDGQVTLEDYVWLFKNLGRQDE